jgi:methionyl aminopeptidase
MVVRKSQSELEKMHRANLLVDRVLKRLKGAIRPGVTTAELDTLAEDTIRDAGATPAFKGYRGFPANLCVSINEEVVHGIPSSKRILSEGDIVSLDVGTVVDGFVGDGAITVPVGEVDEKTCKLLQVTEQALYKGIEQVRVGNRVSDIGHAVQNYVEEHGFSVVRDFVGHGIGTKMHEEPQIPNYGQPGRGYRLLPGMTLAIEPMVNVGQHFVKVLSDNWTVVTTDGSFSAHFEHSVAVTENGPWILSRPNPSGGNGA